MSEAAVRAAQDGQLPRTADIKATGWERVVPSDELTVVTAAPSGTAEGVVVECVSSGPGGSLHVRVVSSGFDPSWRVQFPKDIRVAGARYVVTEVRPAAHGRFYRARGEIKRLL